MNDSPQQPTPLSIEHKIMARVRRAGRGSVWCAAVLLPLGSRNTIDQALRRLAHKGTLRRIAHGLYLYPDHQPLLGELPVAMPSLLATLSVAIDSPLIPSGAYAGYLLGCEPQMPTVIQLLSRETTRTIRVDGWSIHVRPTAARYLVGAGRMIAVLVQAWRYYGMEQVNSAMIAMLRQRIPPLTRRHLWQDRSLAPAWMHPHLAALCAVDDTPQNPER